MVHVALPASNAQMYPVLPLGGCLSIVLTAFCCWGGSQLASNAHATPIVKEIFAKMAYGIATHLASVHVHLHDRKVSPTTFGDRVQFVVRGEVAKPISCEDSRLPVGIQAHGRCKGQQ